MRNRHPVFQFAFAAFAWTVLLSGITTCAQDYESAAEEAVDYQRFPWQEMGEITELDRTEPGHARSGSSDSDYRNGLPERVTRNFNWPNFSLPAWLNFSINSLFWVIIGALILVTATTLIWMYLKMDKRSRNASRFEDYDQEEMISERIKQLPFELQRNHPGHLSDQALQLAQAGNYSRAMMFLFSHVLLSLDKNDLIRLKKGKTNRQYLREIREHQNISSYYRKVMIPFEDSFFGDHQISETRFENCWSDLKQFESSVDTAQQVATP